MRSQLLQKVVWVIYELLFDPAGVNLRPQPGLIGERGHEPLMNYRLWERVGVLVYAATRDTPFDGYVGVAQGSEDA
jgi:hypothetical protein